MKPTSYVIAGVVALALIGAGVLLWRQEQAPSPAPAAPSPAAESPPVMPPASEPAIRHPIDAAVTVEPSTAPLDVDAALIELFGRKAVLSMFQLQDFPRRFVATVDGLGRSHAPAKVWPVNPADGRFSVEKRDGAETISADNALRYTPYVLLVETVNLRDVVAAYARLYPLFQQTYEDIGYHGNYKSAEHHAGDLPSLRAGKDGRAKIDVELDSVTVTPGSASVIGRGLIVHADPDDYKTQPAGNTGARIACGVIQAG